MGTDYVFIGKTSLNLTNYETIWRKQGQELLISPKASNRPKYSIASNDESIYREDTMDDYNDHVLESETRFKRCIRSEPNPMQLEYTVYLGAMKIYQQYGLDYLSRNASLLE